jgi:hypothetical protein
MRLRVSTSNDRMFVNVPNTSKSGHIDRNIFGPVVLLHRTLSGIVTFLSIIIIVYYRLLMPVDVDASFVRFLILRPSDKKWIDNTERSIHHPPLKTVAIFI